MSERDTKNVADAYETVLPAEFGNIGNVERDKLKRLEEELRMQQAFVEVLGQRAGSGRMNRRQSSLGAAAAAAQPTGNGRDD